MEEMGTLYMSQRDRPQCLQVCGSRGGVSSSVHRGQTLVSPTTRCPHLPVEDPVVHRQENDAKSADRHW